MVARGFTVDPEIRLPQTILDGLGHIRLSEAVHAGGNRRDAHRCDDSARVVKHRNAYGGNTRPKQTFADDISSLLGFFGQIQNCIRLEIGEGSILFQIGGKSFFELVTRKEGDERKAAGPYTQRPTYSYVDQQSADRKPPLNPFDAYGVVASTNKEKNGVLGLIGDFLESTPEPIAYFELLGSRTDVVKRNSDLVCLLLRIEAEKPFMHQHGKQPACRHGVEADISRQIG